MSEILVDKHPAAHPEVRIEDDSREIHPILIQVIDASIFRSMVLQISGGARLSGIDALGWRRVSTSFKSTSTCATLLLSTYVPALLIRLPLLPSWLVA
jgi:hypothetical protein